MAVQDDQRQDRDITSEQVHQCVSRSDALLQSSGRLLVEIEARLRERGRLRRADAAGTPGPVEPAARATPGRRASR